MKKMTKSVVAAAVLAATSTAAMAEVSMNVGVTSNYIWRGVTQAADEAAVSGGIDYAHESGVYVGTWVSSLGGGTEVTAGAITATKPSDYELDLYLGYAGEISGIGYDLGYISYEYPNSETDFQEVYLGLSYDMFSVKVSDDSDNDAMYMEAGADIPLPNDFALGLHYGSYDFDAGGDYSDYSVSLSKGDITFSYSDTDENLALGQSDNARIAVSWGTSF
jgi:uncharacterized protein (TIGR02001 family)